jgi:Tfp pilus assembly protein PilX
MSRRAKNRNSASALIVALGFLAFVAVFVSVAFTFTSSISRHSRRSRDYAKAVSIADAALELAFQDWKAQARNHLSTNPNCPLPSFTPTASCAPATVLSSLVGSGVIINNYAVTPVEITTPPTAPPDYTSRRASGGKPGSTVYYFLASADVGVATSSGVVTAKARRIFEEEFETPWRFLTFYQHDLEIQPEGNPIVMGGDIHTNGLFYSGAAELTVTGNVTTALGFVNNWAPGDSNNGLPGPGAHRTPAMPNFASGNPQAVPARNLLGVDSTLLNGADANANNDSIHELIERPVTSGGGAGPDPFDSNRLYNQAGIKVLIDAANNLTIMDLAGVVHSGDAFATTIESAITTNETFQDSREAATVRVATLDISKITSAADSGTLSFNGVIYISDTSGTAGTKRGIRLKRGAQLPASGLTVATNNPLYVWGDYNTGGTYADATAIAPSTQPASNTNGNPPNAANTVGAYTAKPAAIFSDALTVLSNSWLDADSTKSLSQRTPSNTTVNTGIVTGSIATDPVANTFGLGVEGLVRFLENWNPSDIGVAGTQRRFTYYGSFVELYRAEQATGLFTYGNYYTVPKNYWYYQTAFLTDPPKPTLIVPNFRRGRWFLQ